MYLLGHRCSSYVKTRSCPDASLGEGGRVGGCVCCCNRRLTMYIVRNAPVNDSYQVPSASNSAEAAPQQLASSNVCTPAIVGPQLEGESTAAAPPQADQQGLENAVESPEYDVFKESPEYDGFTTEPGLSTQSTANVGLQNHAPPDDAPGLLHQRNADRQLPCQQHHEKNNVPTFGATCLAPRPPAQASDVRIPPWKAPPSTPQHAASSFTASCVSLHQPEHASAQPLPPCRPPPSAFASQEASPSIATMGAAESMSSTPVLSAIELAKLQGEGEQANQSSLGDDGATSAPTVDLTAAPTVDSTSSSSAAAATSSIAIASSSMKNKRNASDIVEKAQWCEEDGSFGFNQSHYTTSPPWLPSLYGLTPVPDVISRIGISGWLLVASQNMALACT